MAKGLLSKFGNRFRILVMMQDDKSTHFNNLTARRVDAIYNQIAKGKGVISCGGVTIPVTSITCVQLYDYDQWNEDQL